MSSFTDEPIKLTPYQPQLPLEAMITTGVRREQQFQQGIDTVNSMEASLLNMPISKTKDYVKEKIGQLNKAISSTISGDFSDRRLLNQIGGLASQISSDPIIQNDIQSTARVQSSITKAKADQERALKEGKNPINNINDLQDGINAWMSDGQINTPFQSDYTPYVDVMERVTKAYDKLHPGQTLAADAIRWNPQTKQHEVNEVIYEGIDAQRIQDVLDIVYSQPDVQAQINVDGRQKFKGMAPVDMSAYMEKSINGQIDNLQKTIIELQIKGATDPTADKDGINEEIKFLTKKAHNLLADGENANKILLGDNPESLKSQLVWNDFTSNFTNAYAYHVAKKSPTFDAFMDKEKLRDARNNEQWSRDIEQKKYDLSVKTYDLSVLKEMRAQAGADGGSSILSVTPITVGDEQGKLGAETAETDLANTKKSYVDLTNKVSNAIAMNTAAPDGQDPIPPPYIYREDLKAWAPNVKGIKKYYKNENMSDEEVVKKAQELKDQIMSRASEGYNKGAVPEGFPMDLYEQSLDEWYKLKDKERIVEKTEAEFAPRIQELKNKIGNEDFASAVIVERKLPGWQTEEKRLITRLGPNWQNDFYGKDDTRKRGDDVVLVHTKGSRESEYKAAKSKITDEDTKILQDRNIAYKRQQYTLNANKVTFKTSTPEMRKTVIERMGSIASSTSNIPGGAKSDYDKFMKQMNERDLGEFTLLEAYYDPTKETGMIVGYKGGKDYSFEVPKEAFERVFPEAVAENTFSKYEQRIRYAQELGMGRTTDVTGKGGDGYQVYHPLYNVWYHVYDIGGQYDVKYWVTDRSGKPIITKASLAGLVPEQSVEALVQKNLKNQQFINDLVKSKTTDGQLKGLQK